MTQQYISTPQTAASAVQWRNNISAHRKPQQVLCNDATIYQHAANRSKCCAMTQQYISTPQTATITFCMKYT
jgi:hypothetical protein